MNIYQEGLYKYMNEYIQVSHYKQDSLIWTCIFTLEDFRDFFFEEVNELSPDNHFEVGKVSMTQEAFNTLGGFEE